MQADALRLQEKGYRLTEPRRTIIAALREAEGSQIEAARLLELPVRTLQHKIKGYGLKRHYAPDDDG